MTKSLEHLRHRKCVIYARVSSLHQARNGYGLHRQFEDGLKCVGVAHLNVVGMFGDVCSGTLLIRPALLGALRAAEQMKADIFLVEAADRLARSREVHELLMRHFHEFGLTLLYFDDILDTEDDYPQRPDLSIVYQDFMTELNK